jgi:hypothetical protein
MRELLQEYLDRRIGFYEALDSQSVAQIDKDTMKLERGLWSAILRSVKTQSNPVMTLVVSGMNDVLNSRGCSQAAWWNRIPVAAGVMIGMIAIASNLMVGYGARRRGHCFLCCRPSAR